MAQSGPKAMFARRPLVTHFGHWVGNELEAIAYY